jgi:hypothetical protein
MWFFSQKIFKYFPRKFIQFLKSNLILEDSYIKLILEMKPVSDFYLNSPSKTGKSQRGSHPPKPTPPTHLVLSTVTPATIIFRRLARLL